jgi:uncharacterized membrane protein HdeD (DUF308 family)
MCPEILTRGGFLARGILALVIGILCFTIPAGMQALIAYIVGIFLLIISLVTGGLALSEPGKMKWLVFILSIIGVIIAVFTFISPFAMFVAFTILIAAWAIITGIAEIVLAYSVEELPFRILLGISGFIAVLFGILIGFAPLPTEGSMILILLLGIYCLIFGIISLVTGMLMKKGEAIVTT